MRRSFLYIISCLFLFGTSSCEDFLDKSPDMGLTNEDVYRNYESIRGYLDYSYTYLDNIYKFDGCKNGRTHIGAISDEFASMLNYAESITVNNGNWLSQSIKSFEIGVGSERGGTSIWKAYQGIRIVNNVIQNLDLVPALTEEQKKQLLGQSYFLRAWFYFQLIKRYGGMPKLDKLFEGDGTEDLPRMTYHESHDWMVSDLDKAIEMLPDEWDDNNTGRPTKLAAMAVKSMAQLYDASPLMQNDLTKTEVKEYDRERAKIAAQSAYKVIDYIENSSQTQYELMGADETDPEVQKEIYRNIFYWQPGAYTQPEYIWYNRSQNEANSYDYSRYIRSFWLPGELAKGDGNDAVSYNAPTQNMVDLFDKKVGGTYYPISDSRANYDLSDPYKNRDPRFYNNILCPGDEWGKDNNNVPQYITTYVNGAMYNTTKTNKETNKRTQTGYLCKKYIWPQANQWTNGYNLYRTITVYIRVAQIYLDFAEAAFEYAGDAKAKIEGCGNLTAEDAINKIRNRVGVTDLPADIVSDPQKFREAYRRERAVELMFENNRWWDVRRWMIAHELFKEPIKGIIATPTNPNADISSMKFTYEIDEIETEQRIFDMRNYWYPFSLNDVAGLKNLVQNPGW